MRKQQRYQWQGRPFRIALTSIAIGLLIFAAWQYRVAIVHIWSTANIAMLISSILLALLANYLTGLPFNGFLQQSDMGMPSAKACYLQLVVQTTKYVPGNIWGAILQAQIIGTQRVGAMFIAGINTTLFFMLTLSTTGLALLLYKKSIAAALIVLLLGWLLAATIATSSWLLKLGAIAARVLGKKNSVPSGARSIRETGRFFAWACLHATVHIGSVLTLLIATTHFDLTQVLTGTASILLAWVIGTAAIIVPSGLGVREVAFVSFATMFGVSAEPATLTAIALIARVAQTMPDIVAAGIIAITELNRRSPVKAATP